MQRATFGKRNAPGSAAQSQPRASASQSSRSKMLLWSAIAGFALLGTVLFGQALKVEVPTQAAVAPVANTEGLVWVTTQRLARHTCPSTACGIVGEFYYRDGVKPLETQNGWTRVSKYYVASCENGRSAYVDTGNDRCSQANGIVDGQFAEWVVDANLSTERPADPAADATGLAKSIGGSDDFNLYQAQFVQAAQQLIDQNLCTEAELADWGGFYASVNLRPRKAYFVHCGNDRHYLDVTTMEIFR